MQFEQRLEGRYFLEETLRHTKTTWIVTGIVELVVGLVALAMPVAATIATTLVLAVILGIAGITRLVHAFQVRAWGGVAFHVVLGLLYVAAAVLVFSRPLAGAVGLTLVVGGWCIAFGLVQVVLALRKPRIPAWGWVLAAGVAGIALGVMLFAGWPATGLWAIGLLVGVNLVFTGVGLLMVGLAIPSVREYDRPGGRAA
jgi:uncharacterized membrane protein HdeD (DUF308 family)